MDTKICSFCQKPFAPAATGRPPTFCKSYCRVAFWRERKRGFRYTAAAWVAERERTYIMTAASLHEVAEAAYLDWAIHWSACRARRKADGFCLTCDQLDFAANAAEAAEERERLAATNGARP